MTFNKGDKVRYVGPPHNEIDPTVYTVDNMTADGFVVRWTTPSNENTYANNNHYAKYTFSSSHYFELIEEEKEGWTTVEESNVEFLKAIAERLGVEIRTITQYRIKEESK